MFGGVIRFNHVASSTLADTVNVLGHGDAQRPQQPD
jgi:hypothetical protein